MEFIMFNIVIPVVAGLVFYAFVIFFICFNLDVHPPELLMIIICIIIMYFISTLWLKPMIKESNYNTSYHDTYDDNHPVPYYDPVFGIVND